MAEPGSTGKLSDRLQQLAAEVASLEQPGGHAPAARPLEIVIPEQVKLRMDSLGDQASQYAAVPLMHDDAAAAPALDVDDPRIESYCIIYKKWLGAPANTVCVRVRGESMCPILNDGSIVAINRSRRGPGGLNGKIVAVRNLDQGGLLVRRVIMDARHLTFVPENPDYNPRTGEPRNPTLIVERRPHDNTPAPPNPIIGKIDWAWSLFP